MVPPVAGFQDTEADLAESGGPWHSLLWVLLWLFSFPAGGNRGREGAARTPTKVSSCADGELISAGSSRTTGEGWAGGRKPPLGGFGDRCSTYRASPLHHHMGMFMSWCVNIAVRLQRETCSSWLSRFFSCLKVHSMDVMVYSTMTVSECSAPETCLSFLHS